MSICWICSDDGKSIPQLDLTTNATEADDMTSDLTDVSDTKSDHSTDFTFEDDLLTNDEAFAGDGALALLFGAVGDDGMAQEAAFDGDNSVNDENLADDNPLALVREAEVDHLAHDDVLADDDALALLFKTEDIDGRLGDNPYFDNTDATERATVHDTLFNRQADGNFYNDEGIRLELDIAQMVDSTENAIVKIEVEPPVKFEGDEIIDLTIDD